MLKQPNNQKEISEVIENKLPEVKDYEEHYGESSERRFKKKTRQKTNESSGGTLAGQQQRMKTNLGYRRASQKEQRRKVKMKSGGK